MPRLTAHDAIAYAERYGLTLRKHADPTDEARQRVTVAEAREIATEDPSLIYLEPDTHAGPAEPLENILAAYQITLCPGQDGIPVAQQSIPIALARECVRRLQAAGAEASDAPDTDDPSRAWVYVTTTPPQH